jgi:DNA-binding MarR family transcriptional regulator
MTINALARELVMDRTTLGRNILPLEREGLIEIRPGETDRRSKDLHLSERGAARLRVAAEGWREAQREFAARFGAKRAAELRAILHAVTETELGADR